MEYFDECRPHYLPSEFTVAFIVTVPVRSSTNLSVALWELHDQVGELQNKHPEPFFGEGGAFNRTKLTDTLLWLYKHVSIATRGNNTLDQVYTKRWEAYRAVTRPHLGFSDHLSIKLIAPHHPVLTHNKPTQKAIILWPNTAISMLQDCFE